jgi:proteasome assembly chaperone (PAC2) family protein
MDAASPGSPGSVPSEGAHLRWQRRPKLDGPILIAGFEGWNDAGDAASSAIEFLRDRWDAAPFAEVDPEDFYDFTATRPRVQFDDDFEREIVWPANTFSSVTLPGTDRDVVILTGTEPQLRWRTFCAQIIHVAKSLDVRRVVTLGALLAEVPHSRPVSVFGTAYTEDVIAQLGLSPSRYEGPTGIVGVLHAACQAAGLESASLWAAVPTYLPGAPSPKAALALVERTAQLVDASVTTTELEIASASYERQINELVEEDDETAEYVEQLEQRYDDDDDDIGDADGLVEQVERFLREQRD